MAKKARFAKLTAVSTLVAQIPEGKEVDVVIDDEGTVYYPATQMKVLTGGADETEDAAPTKTRGGKTTEEVPAEETAKKTRGAGRGAGRGAAKTEKEEKEASAEVDVKKITDVLTKYDSSTMKADAAEDALLAMAGGDKKLENAVSAAFTEFSKDPSMKVEEAVDLVVKALGGETADEGADGDADGGVDIGSLKVNDRVIVTFEGSEFEDGDYAGEVVKIGRGGKPVFHFDDDDDDVTFPYNEDWMVAVAYEPAKTRGGRR